MPTRLPEVAGMFYPVEARACREQVERCLAQATPRVFERPILGGVVPHAGWVYSGPTAAQVFAALHAQPQLPETIILFGAVHNWGVNEPSLYAAGSWRTPLGDLFVDEELAQAVLQVGAGALVNRPSAHNDEHSIEVQLPFLRYLFPEARILPIAMPPLPDAPALGARVAQAVQQQSRRAVAIGSSDLTHYGPRYGLAPAGVGEAGLTWAHENDRRMLDLVVARRANEIVSEARQHHNACGAGAVAATVGYANALGATEGTLLAYTTSHEVMPRGRPTDLVGYGAVVLT